jgi:undecaprenyl-diphosphatase
MSPLDLDRDLAIRMNQALVGRWPDSVDVWLVQLAYNDALKGAVVVALLAALWAARRPNASGERCRRARSRLLGGVLVVLVALAANRLLASALPFRPRPLHVLPPGDFLRSPALHGGAFAGLSAFPSDHAVMFCGLAMVALRAHLRLGTLALLHALSVLLPRLILGLHWLSDMIAGAALVALFLLGGHLLQRRTRVFEHLLRRAERHPATAAALGASLAFGYSTLFAPHVELARLLASAFR